MQSVLALSPGETYLRAHYIERRRHGVGFDRVGAHYSHASPRPGRLTRPGVENVPTAHAVDLDETLGRTARGDRNAVDLEVHHWLSSLGGVSDRHPPGLISASLRPQLAAEIDESPVYVRQLESLGCGPECGTLAEAPRIHPGGGVVADDGPGVFVD